MRLGIISHIKMSDKEKHPQSSSEATAFNHIYNYLNMTKGWQQTLDDVTTGDAAKAMSDAALTSLRDLKGILWWIEIVNKKNGRSDVTLHPVESNAKDPTELECLKALAAEGLVGLRRIPVIRRGRLERRKAKLFIESACKALDPVTMVKPSDLTARLARLHSLFAGSSNRSSEGSFMTSNAPSPSSDSRHTSSTYDCALTAYLHNRALEREAMNCNTDTLSRSFGAFSLGQ